MDPLLIFSLIGVVVSTTILIYGLIRYYRGQKLYDRFIQALENYLKEEVTK